MLEPNDVSIHGHDRLRYLRRLAPLGDLTIRERLELADRFTSYGLPDEAMPIIERLLGGDVSNASVRRYLERLIRINGYVAAIDNPVTESNNPELYGRLLSQTSSFWTSPTGSRRLIVVFSTSYNNFDISFPVLHAVLQGHGCSILYVKNPGRGMFTSGSPGFGDSIDAMALGLLRFCERMGSPDIRVCGFSSGGYASLYAAAVLKASSYLGFGIKTDWSADSPLKVIPGRAAPADGDRATNTLVNLRSVAAMAQIGRAVLCYGDRDRSDRAHADNMGDLANFATVPVPGANHSVVLSLIAAGRFDGILAQFVNDGPG